MEQQFDMPRPSCTRELSKPTSTDGAWAIEELRCSKGVIRAGARIEITGVVLRARDCFCPEDTACEPCIEQHDIADSPRSPFVIVVLGGPSGEWPPGTKLSVPVEIVEPGGHPTVVAVARW